MTPNLTVLVLNADFVPLNLVPISTVTWQKSFKLIHEGVAVPLKYYEGEFAHTQHKEYPIPSVIVMKDYKHFKKFAKWSKFNVKLRDEFKCQYCGTRVSNRSLTIDHVNPKALGGRHGWKNSVAACKSCNQTKRDKKGIRPIRPPYRPDYYELAKKMLAYKRVQHKDWEIYVQHIS
jgi:5-methylcytosine-specific restriction endonuclease McrA